jgi:uncharacterized protein (TIGR02147 family)
MRTGYIDKGGRTMVTIFDFTDYRAYLKAYFIDRKERDKSFSHRWLARRLELATSNFIMLVMQGKRNLTSGLCLAISEVFKHTKKEAEYFENIVGFNQAKTGKEKDLYFSRMMAFRKNLKVDKIAEWQYEYYSNWHHPVIRELVASPHFSGDPAALAKMLLPSITPQQVKHSIELLAKLGMIERRGKKYHQTSPLLTTGPEVNSLAVANFHRNMGRLAIEALDRVPREERNISSSTIFITGETFDTIRKRIEEFRKELLGLADAGQQGERVYQMNFQLFPVSKPIRNKG